MRKPNTTKSTEGFDTPSLLRPKRRISGHRVGKYIASRA